MKKLANLKPGAYFFYGGVQWILLENDDKIGATLAIAAEPVFEQAFDVENCNDWRKSSLRRELNGPFLDALIAEGANRADFFDRESDLTADDGMTNYGTARDKIALISCDLYRKYRALLPKIECWWWTLTPRTRNPSNSYYVCGVNSTGALYYCNAYNGTGGVRPLCYLESSILVPVPYDDEIADPRADMIEEARDAVLDTLNDYPADIWGDVLAAVTSAVFAAKIDAAEIEREEAAKRALLLAPGMTVELTRENSVTVKIEGRAISAGTIVAMAADEIGNHGGTAEG